MANDFAQYIQLSRNVCLFPWVRDRRTKLDWQWSARHSRWFTDLNQHVRLHLPGNVPDDLKRAPTAFEFGLLCYLLASAYSNGSGLEFKSQAQILRALDYPYNERNRKRLDDGLLYWSLLVIRYTNHQKQGDPTITLPPLVDHYEIDNGVSVQINSQWFETCAQFFVSIPLPLPAEVSAINLVVWLLTQQRDWIRDDPDLEGWLRIRKQEKVRMRHAIGISGEHGGARLKIAIRHADKWFRKNGGRLNYVDLDDGTKLGFVFDPPKRRMPVIQKPKMRREHINVPARTERIRVKPRQHSAPRENSWSPLRDEDGVLVRE